MQPPVIPAGSDPRPTAAQVSTAAARFLAFGEIAERDGENIGFSSVMETLFHAESIPWPPSEEWGDTETIGAAAWFLAAAEAALLLVGGGSLVPIGTARVTVQVLDNGGPRGTSREHGRYSVSVPASYRLSARLRESSSATERHYYPDLYLEASSLRSAHPRVRRAAHEAVQSFRSGHYLASAVMLGSAVEGGWLELIDSWNGNRHSSRIDPERGLAAACMKVIERIVAAPEKDLRDRAGVNITECRGLIPFADHLRDYRNFAAHFDTRDTFDLSHHSLSALLSRSAAHFERLYRLTDALKEEVIVARSLCAPVKCRAG